MSGNNKSLKIFLLCTVLFCSAAASAGFRHADLTGFRYGPNLSWRTMGNAPFVWGQWLPQLEESLTYTWLEPLESLSYGEKLGKNPTYLKMSGSMYASPFYGGYSAGLGVNPFKSNPQLELDFVYESYLFFGSNQEMVTTDVEGEGRIADTWNADYIVDNLYDDETSKNDYAQLFDICAKISYRFPKGSVIGVDVHYVLSDISTDYNGKSYDFIRNIPVFSRDYIIEINSYGRAPVTEHFALVFETDYYKTGLLRNGKTIEKEALSYGRIMIGPHLSWKDGFRNIILELGAFQRGKDRFYEGSLSQQFLIQLEYQGYFTFPVRRNFSE